jgi:anti-sigma B factor antagonist
MDLSIERHERGEAVVLTLVGRLDAETGGDLESAVRTEMSRGFHAIRLDLQGVNFLSSAGIRCLFETQRTAKTSGGTCFLIAASATVRKVLDLTRLTPILMEPAAVAGARTTGMQAQEAAGQGGVRHAVDVRTGAVQFLALEEPCGPAIVGDLLGSCSDAMKGRSAAAVRRQLTRQTCGLGLGAISDATAATARAGELAAVGGALFHRPPHPHAMIDYIVPTGDLKAEATLLSGLIWHGLPTGRAGFESAGDEASVRLDSLVESLFAHSTAETLAIVVAGEVHGLVGAELIRPLSDVSDGDFPLAGRRETTASWLSFSREPVYARHTALIVGVARRHRESGDALAPFLRPFPGHETAVHLHAIVFPYRPLRRGGVDLSTTVGDLAGTAPVAVMHLVVDPQPVLGSGCSELVRGCVWYAPLEIRAVAAEEATS